LFARRRLADAPEASAYLTSYEVRIGEVLGALGRPAFFRPRQSLMGGLPMRNGSPPESRVAQRAYSTAL
jgi:hypothetical protein